MAVQSDFGTDNYSRRQEAMTFEITRSPSVGACGSEAVVMKNEESHVAHGLWGARKMTVR